jgi:hypothetical protein
MMIRNMFVREEPDRLVIASGLFGEWLEDQAVASFGPSLTPWGPVSIRAAREGHAAIIEVDAAWRTAPPRVDVRLPGFAPVDNVDSSRPVKLSPDEGRLSYAGAGGKAVVQGASS